MKVLNNIMHNQTYSSPFQLHVIEFLSDWTSFGAQECAHIKFAPPFLEIRMQLQLKDPAAFRSNRSKKSQQQE